MGTGCSTVTPIEPKDDYANAKVYSNEYIFTADGPFSPYPKAEGNPVLPAGTYKIGESGKYKLIKPFVTAKSRGIVTYNPEEDYCKVNNISNCEPNWVLSIDNTDPMLGQMWNHEKFPFPDVDTSNIKILVLDSGTYCEHEDLICEKEYDANKKKEGTGASQDLNGHGTHVAGIIGALDQNGKGIRGVARGPKIYSAKFLGANGSGSILGAVEGIRWGITHQVDIINMSFGAGVRSKALEEAITDAHNAGIILVAAAGNEGVDNGSRGHYPSNFKEVIGIASHEASGKLSDFSNYGPEYVDGAAPGGSILSTLNTGDYGRLSGTSMAAPHVTGLLATILSETDIADKRTRAKRAVQLLRERYTIPWEEGKLRYGLFKGVAGRGPSCKSKKCKTCFSECLDKFKCRCKKWSKCKADCRKQTNCNTGCKP